MSARPAALLMVCFAAAGCQGEALSKPDEPDTAGLTCPNDPTGEVPAGDANGDGAVDLADVLVILRASAEGGPPAVCDAAVDLLPDGYVQLDDAFSLLVHLYEGGFSLPEGVECDDATPLPSPECSAIEARVTFGMVRDTAGAVVELRADTAAIEGWSLSVHAEGCTIAAASTAGTQGASVADDPAGLRDLGYDATFLVDEGAVSAVVLDFMGAGALPAGAWSPVLALTLEAGDACTCTVRIGDPLAALGEPVESLVVAGGAAWPVSAEGTVDLCR